MNPENVKIYNRIKGLADTKGIKIAELERNIGFGNGKIGKWRNSPKSPTYESLLSIAAYFESTVAYLTGETDDPSVGIKKDPIPKDEAEISEFRKRARELVNNASEKDLENLLPALERMFGQ